MRASIKQFRRVLHANPQVSNFEEATAKRIVDFLGKYSAISLLHRDVGGGHGLVFEVVGDGGEIDADAADLPTVLLRSDMDALPLVEESCVPHKSIIEGAHHACGHDGHAAMLAAALIRLSNEQSTFRGRVLGVFQPAEETGDGALQMTTALPDLMDAVTHGAFGIHNIPGATLGAVMVRPEGIAARVRQIPLTYQFGRSCNSAPNYYNFV